MKPNRDAIFVVGRGKLTTGDVQLRTLSALLSLTQKVGNQEVIMEATGPQGAVTLRMSTHTFVKSIESGVFRQDPHDGVRQYVLTPGLSEMLQRWARNSDIAINAPAMMPLRDERVLSTEVPTAEGS